MFFETRTEILEGPEQCRRWIIQPRGTNQAIKKGCYAEDGFKHELDLRWQVRFLTVMIFPL